jgi:RimJ/RimL family protein N-acetyltransferase
VAAGGPTRLLTRRLTLHRARQAEAPALAAVFASNLEFLRASWACHQPFDAAEAARYLETESQRENGLCLSIVERATRRVIGMAALLVPNPADGVPWIGLLIVAADRQDAGLGGEAASALERLLERQGWPEVRLNVLVANDS